MYRVRGCRTTFHWPMVLATVMGCSLPASDDAHSDGPNFANLVPVTGVVTLNGKPLAKAIVTFLPDQWGPGTGETDENGRYNLVSTGHPGISPGEYRVSISYYVDASGEARGQDARGDSRVTPEMATAKEQLPPEYSDLGRTKLTRVVGPQGGTFDFDLKATLPPLNLPSDQKK